MKPTAPAQPLFSFLPTVVPQGDGSFVVRPGRPVQWVSIQQAADYLQVDDSTIRRWIAEGVLPEKITDPKTKAVTQVLRKRSPKLWELNLPVVEQLKEHWTNTALR